MSHVVLLGDSIFDNARYVPGGPAVLEQLRKILPNGWQVTLLARDGAVTSGVMHQLDQLPKETTHLIVSAGGNNALDQNSMLLHEQGRSFSEMLSQLAEIREQFRQDYRDMVEALLNHNLPTAVCTIYDSIPGLDQVERFGLSLFNEVILREAFRAVLPVIDLRLICTDAADYAHSSPIEPSILGGRKIASVITRLLTKHDFQAENSCIFS